MKVTKSHQKDYRDTSYSIFLFFNKHKKISFNLNQHFLRLGHSTKQTLLYNINIDIDIDIILVLRILKVVIEYNKSKYNNGTM